MSLTATEVCVCVVYLYDLPYGTWGCCGAAWHLIIEDENPPLKVGDILLICMCKAPSITTCDAPDMAEGSPGVHET